ncbi:glycosyltransferase [Rhizobiales bacterium RZME27]|jgi:glycosyltransferase involved in cell wall biosynthesis|uniref:Glycosyltransferase n=1 Tax=Endobacterium cereale TaxID=2663029 RepID=A0A6A8ACT4_9HYPH|nr:glycosyltransferase family 4 protein [Endobacterium cereale]MEB2845429.1 glycosyltransferase family 4 protein [Endobacterium cereale]MQY48942.1 glycosyltransferase [Endobacterium cereale]
MSVLSFVRSLFSAAGAAKSARGGRSRIWVIGPMPQPLNGQTNYNRHIVAEFEKHAPVTVLPTGGTGAEKIAAALVLPLIILFSIPRKDHVYTSPPGQNGLWLFMGCLAALRLKRLDHFIHHHSFRPINLGPTRSARALVAVSGPYQRHVFLSEKMRDRYADLYFTPELKARSFVLPNAYLFFKEKPAGAVRSGPITMGHLSVLTREKGVDYLIALAERIFAKRDDFRFVLAGPVRDESLKAEILAFCQKYPYRAEYLGPVYDDAKDAFYQRLDMFALPSRLIDEADPLVILEAYGYGCDILASSTGCIPERLRTADRLMSFDLDRDTELLDSAITDLAANRQAIAEAGRAHIAAMHRRSVAQANIFFSALEIDTPADPDAAFNTATGFVPGAAGKA